MLEMTSLLLQEKICVVVKQAKKKNVSEYGRGHHYGHKGQRLFACSIAGQPALYGGYADARFTDSLNPCHTTFFHYYYKVIHN